MENVSASRVTMEVVVNTIVSTHKLFACVTARLFQNKFYVHLERLTFGGLLNIENEFH